MSEQLHPELKKLEIPEKTKQFIQTSILPAIPKEDRPNFFACGLPATLTHNPNQKSWKTIAKIMPKMPQNYLWTFFAYLLPATLRYNPTPEALRQTWKTISEIIPYIPQDHHWFFFTDSLHTTLERKPTTTELAQQVNIAKSYISRHPDDDFFGKIVAENFGRLAPENRRIGRLKFKKTGSQLIPLSGSLTGYMIRIIRPAAFEAWKIAHQDEQLKDHIEPILAAKEFIEKTGKSRALEFNTTSGEKLVRVYSRYAGKQLPAFIKANPRHAQEVTAQKEQIFKRLEELGINFGHQWWGDPSGRTHERNFVVEMMDGKPVVRLIDFDQAAVRPNQ